MAVSQVDSMGKGRSQDVKRLISTRALSEEKGKVKVCIICDSPATQEALFELSNIVLSERYCASCIEEIK